MILALAFLVAALLVFFDFIQPAYGDLEQEKGVEISTEQLLTNEQQMVSQAKALLSQYESESQAQSNLSLAMPSGPDLASALAQIYGIAQNNNVNVQGINVSAPTIQLQSGGSSEGTAGTPPTLSQIVKPIGAFSMQVSSAGSYEDMKNFLSQIETNVRLFDVTALSLQAVPVAAGAKSSATADFFTYNITVTTYYQLP